MRDLALKQTRYYNQDCLLNQQGSIYNDYSNLCLYPKVNVQQNWKQMIAN